MEVRYVMFLYQKKNKDVMQRERATYQHVQIAFTLLVHMY